MEQTQKHYLFPRVDLWLLVLCRLYWWQAKNSSYTLHKKGGNKSAVQRDSMSCNMIDEQIATAQTGANGLACWPGYYWRGHQSLHVLGCVSWGVCETVKEISIHLVSALFHFTQTFRTGLERCFYQSIHDWTTDRLWTNPCQYATHLCNPLKYKKGWI